MGLDALLRVAFGLALSNLAGLRPALPWAAGASGGSAAPSLGELMRQLSLHGLGQKKVSAVQELVMDSPGHRDLCDLGYGLWAV